MFRVLLFKFFNRIETWELLSERLGEIPWWKGYRFAAYDRVLGDAMSRGERVYPAAYIYASDPDALVGDALVHRDPNPTNFVVSGGRAWLVDWDRRYAARPG